MMAIRVLVFDPMQPVSIEKFEQDLDFYLSDGWHILNSVAGNRTGVAEGVPTIQLSSVVSPEFKDYVVFVLRHPTLSQETMDDPQVWKHSQ